MEQFFGMMLLFSSLTEEEMVFNYSEEEESIKKTER